MCGVAGLIDKKNKFSLKKRENLVKNMLNIISHRGGDAVGVESKGTITVGHTRLSIIDITASANQPFFDTDSLFSFNGEIYNHQELRGKYLNDKELHSHSDTTTLFSLLIKFPIKDVLNKIQGMFAFSYFDARKKVLFLTLDKYAIKPLYYIDTPDYFAWASEIKAFKAIPKFQFQLEEKNLKEYLIFRYVAGDNTLFKDIYKMQPGEYLTYLLHKNSFSKSKYYNLTKAMNNPSFSEKMLENSVKDHLMGDVTAGVQLSGGVDSSIIALFAQKHSKKNLHTFSIGLKDNNWNEFYYSDQVAKKLKTNHHKIVFSKKDFADLLPKITHHLDEPIVHPNTIPMYLLAKTARKFTKVLLTGEGADEVFYGYNRYFNLKNKTDDIIFSNSFADPADISKILKSKNKPLLFRKKLIHSANTLKYDKQISIYDMGTYLPHVLLRQDKAGMAANIENRVPFLYQPVVEAGFNSSIRIGEFGGKQQIKRIALKYFPKELVLRRKCGFGLPIAGWLRDRDALKPHLSELNTNKLINKYFDIDVIKQLVNEHLEGKKDNSSILFTLVCFTVWSNVFFREKL